MQFTIRAVLLFAASLLGACSTVPTNHETVRGRYELRPGSSYYAGEWFVLRDGKFEGGIFTDCMDDPRLKHFPVRGRYSLRGCLLTFHHPLIFDPQRILLRRGERFTMWTPQEYAEFLRTHRTSGSVLYQTRK